MRYIMKGGVWKNSEDQILKAAIMKYGMNQWSRISSLLQRKSAKQCKQRWYEWLDPSIKKTQWTRGEDQKLLQLARVFPSQWRTVAPFVGRTPSQCYDRYEKLLDMAQGKSIKETEDLKKLRPGEIDPNPQTKPARLDAIDMDEDEKEMLAEVRVRLANTKGKKAKRKQREKIIEQARRLAQLQKIRQLQMAGVDNIPTAKEIKRMKQNKSIDYNKQIPFERQIPEFKYSHQDEDEKAPTGTSYANTISLQTLQGKRRDVEEELQRKMDKRRMKKLKERDLKTVIAMKDKFQKPASFPIQLPQPQITQKDLQEMKRFNITTPLNSQLLSNAGQTPMAMTPHNQLLFSARVNMSLNHENLFSRDEQNDNEQKEQRDDEGHVDGIQGLNYLKKIQYEKKMGLNQPLRSIDRVISQKRVKTPLLNEWQQGSSTSTNKIKSLFSRLAKPQNQVEFQIPQQQEQEEEEQKVMDAQEAERIERLRMVEEQERRKQQQSQALKKNLPRFKIIPDKVTFFKDNEVLKLIQTQMATLIYSDAVDYPVQGSIFPDTAPQYKQTIESEQINEAKRLVSQQMQRIRKQQGQIDIDLIDKVRKRVKIDYQKQTVTLNKQPLTEKASLEQQCRKYLSRQQPIKNAVKSVQSNNKKNKKLLGGYQKLIKTKIQQVNTLNEQLQTTISQRLVLEQIRKVQRQSITSRFQSLNTYCKQIYKVV